MNTEFFEALAMIAKEKGIEQDELLEKIKSAITTAVKRDYQDPKNVVLDIDPMKGSFNVYISKMAVEEVEDPTEEIYLEEALKYNKRAKIGEMVDIKLETKQFGRIAAQTAKHIIRQGIREAEREQLLKEFQSRQQDIATGLVTRTDPRKGSVTLEIGHSEAVLSKSEQIPGEQLSEGDRVKIYVAEAVQTEKGPRIMISRTHPGLVKRLFEMEVPEIYDGTVEIKSVSREAGSRTKIAVYSKNEDVDAVGACIGPKGARVAEIVNELCGEKIDVVKYSEKPEEFIAAALSPSEVISVQIENEAARACRVIVPADQLSLAIGNKGQNVRLAARLTGWKIDIHPEGEELEDFSDEPMQEDLIEANL
ncbi:transcription termination factor NusA [Candidatus Soleaferrea massiliensis]|uniref:transcription termination factor NusA n=1 Tax=Candidatus Soleaferrea massiliensis TaxID=1470354 RepID=UPI000591828F|nr:transcription termination factor NusA [Candidatus Soleaferrea massiliensis]